MNYPLCSNYIRLLTIVGLVFYSSLALGEWRGNIALEGRYFPNDAVDLRQFDNENLSLSAQPEYYTEWDEGRQSVTFTPFGRLDQNDSERSHGDIRELFWQYVGDDYEWRVGVGKVFWGVAESVHLVDIINQTDFVENIDFEDKLGQPMANLSLIQDWGTLDIFLLPYFRERTFPGEKGRLRSIPVVDTRNAVYESSREEYHLDGAIRWSHTLGEWDVGLYQFYGTSRDPVLIPSASSSGGIVLVPLYVLINQTGLDVQATLGNWLWKLEAFYRDSDLDNYFSSVAGFEYTFYGIFTTPADFGLVAEYQYDERGENASSPFQNDMMIGLRLTPNDVQSTEILLGTIYDFDSGEQSYNFEASRRLTDHWKLEIEARAISNSDTNSSFYSMRKDDYLQVELGYYF